MARLIRIVLVVVAVGMAAGIVHAAWALGMADRVHLRYIAHAFPTVLSAMFYHLPWNYTAYQGVTRALVMARDASGSISDAALLAATHLSGFDQTIRFFPFDDKGYADLAWLGFKIFGVAIASVFWAYILLFVSSVGVYLLGLRNDLSALVLLNIVLAGVYAALFAFPVSRELGEITNPRALGLLSIIATAHLLYVTIRRAPLGVLGGVAVLLQSVLLVFVIFCRSPEIWQACLVGLVAVAMVVRLGRRPPTFAPLIVIGALVLSLIGLNAYQHAFFHPNYFKSYGQYRLVWHNFGIGFALNPHLARAYGLTISDSAMFALVAKRAKEQGIYNQVFTNKDTLLLNPIGDFERYEKIARDIDIEIIAAHPWQAFLTFVFYKPRQLLLAFKAAMWNGDARRPDFEVAYISDAERAKLDAYLTLYRPLPLLVIAISGLAALGGAKEWEWRPMATVIGLIWLGTLIPPMASYPLYHIMGMTFAATCAAFFAIAVGVFVRGAAWVRGGVVAELFG